ncbi:MAG: SRPBCC family protein [Myxococcota bacterium]
MKIDVVTQIARPIDEVWALVADDFTSIQRWSASVVTSDVLTDVTPADGSPVSGRYCTFTDDPKGFGAREEITSYDKENHVLKFDVEPMNAPAALPLRKNHVVLTLRALGPSETEVRWVAEPELKAHGYVLYPMLKLGLAKAFRGILGELKKYAEAGEGATEAGLHLGATG